MTINNIACKLIEKSGKNAKIEIEGQVISVPKEYLPEKTADGEILQLYFSSQNSAKMKEKDLAQAILQEILNGGK